MKLIKASFIAFLITMIISSFILFFNLDIGETPEKSDVIIVAGGQLYREAKAKDLLEQGYSTSNKVIVSPITQNQKMPVPLSMMISSILIILLQNQMQRLLGRMPQNQSK